MKEIKMVDLFSQYEKIKHEIDQAMQAVLNETAFIQGPQVGKFAKELAEFVGAKAVIPCANGTDALQIAMMALDLQPGDEVIVPVHTYVATAEVIALLQLKPVFVDVDPLSFSIDINQIESKVTSKTKAIVPVHLYGQCCDMESLLQVAAKHKLHVIEDAAQALGAKFTFSDGSVRRAGTMGVIGTTSFFPSKNLGCFGDGGAIFTNDDKLAEKITMVANHGQKVKYYHEIVGVNSRLDTLQAAVLSVKLKYLNQYEAARNQAANRYDELLKDVSPVIVPSRSKNSTHVFHQYTLRVQRRDELKTFLQKAGIPSMIYYPVPLHLQNAYRQNGVGEGSFPVAEQLSKEVISLPIHTEMEASEQEYICNKIKEFYHG